MKIAREIVSFDRHHDFEPGPYRLVPKEKSNQLGVRHHPSGKHTDKNRKHTPKRKYYRTARVRLLTSKTGQS